MPKIEIKTKGCKAEIAVDGKVVPGVRGYTLSHQAGEIPKLTLDLPGYDLYLDGSDFIPCIPEVFQHFYELKNPSDKTL